MLEEFVAVRRAAITVDFFRLDSPFGRGPTFRCFYTKLIVICALGDVCSATSADETTIGHHLLGHGIGFHVNLVYEMAD